MGPPFLLLVVVSLFLMVLMTNCQTATLQDTGLCGIVAATNIQSVIPEWSCDADGNPDSNVCSWSGLECNDNDEVISLSLVSYTLFGTLPSSIGLLSALSYLSIQNTNLYDEIPTTIGYLNNVTTLNLNYNALGTSIPSVIGSMSSLQDFSAIYNQFYEFPTEICNSQSITRLDLTNNYLTGQIPSEIGNMVSMEYIYLDSNNFHGSFPTSWAQMKRLMFLSVQENALSGSLPAELGDIYVVDQMYLGENFFDSSLPSTIGSLHNLRVLSLRQNSITGQIPETIGTMSRLEILELQRNSLNGTLPYSIGRLTNMLQLDFQYNSLSSSIPSSIGNWTLVDSIYWNNNLLTGPIPSAFGDMVEATTIDLHFNSLSGSIPSTVGKMSLLSIFDVNTNKLNGTIPSTIGSLSLTLMDMAYNYLSGPIPTTIGQLSGLNSILLSGNKLSGPLPTSLGLLSNLYELYLDSNSLTGPIPRTVQYMYKLQYLYAQSNKLSSDIPSELGLVSLLKLLDMSSNNLVGTIPSSMCDLSDMWEMNVKDNPELECYPFCLMNTIVADSTIQEGCGSCSAGEYFVPDTYHCVPCTKGTYNKVPTDIHVINVTACKDCPAYTTTIGSGQTTCALFQLEDDKDVIYAVLGVVLSTYMFCWFAAGHESMVLLFNMVIPMMDHLTDIYYVMNEGFYSPILFACAAFFLIAPCFIFGYELVSDDIQPVWLYTPFEVWWDCPAASPRTHGRNCEFYVRRMYFSIGQCFTLLFTCFWLVLYWSSMLVWFIIGSFLHNSRTLAVGRVRRMWYKAWSQTDRFGDDIATVDVDVLNRLLFHGFVLETAPQVVIQMVNSILVGWGFIAKLSIAMSIIQVCFGIYKFIYWKWFRGIEFKNIPVLSSKLPAFLQLPVQTSTARTALITKNEVNSSCLSAGDKEAITKREVCEHAKCTDPILIESQYEPPKGLLAKCLWLKNIEGVPTYRGLTVFAIFVQHDNPLKLLYLIILWSCCIFLQLCSIILSPFWICFYDHVNLFALESHEDESNHWLITLNIVASALCWMYSLIYWSCFGGNGELGNDDHNAQYEKVQCGSTRHLTLILYISLLSGIMAPLCISRTLEDRLWKKLFNGILSWLYILVYLYLLTNAFAKHRQFYDYNYEDYALGGLIAYMFFSAMVELLIDMMQAYESSCGICWFQHTAADIISISALTNAEKDNEETSTNTEL